MFEHKVKLLVKILKKKWKKKIGENLIFLFQILDFKIFDL